MLFISPVSLTASVTTLELGTVHNFATALLFTCFIAVS